MRRSYFRTLNAALSVGAALAATSPASAQTVEQFYKGKTITVLVGTSPGGINDITARFAAKHLSRYHPRQSARSTSSSRPAAAAWSPPTGSPTPPRVTA